MEKEPITIRGLEKLKSELEELKTIKRPKIVAAIAEARSHGDLKENAEYHAAKEQQAQMESRVIEINDTIARANVIDVTKITIGGNFDIERRQYTDPEEKEYKDIKWQIEIEVLVKKPDVIKELLLIIQRDLLDNI